VVACGDVGHQDPLLGLRWHLRQPGLPYSRACCLS